MNCQDARKGPEIHLSFLAKLFENSNAVWKHWIAKRKKVWHPLPPPLSLLFSISLS